MEPQVYKSIQGIQECNRTILTRLTAINKYDKPACHLCQSKIERLSKGVSDLKIRVENLFSSLDNTQKHQSEIESRLTDIQSQICDMQSAVHKSGSDPTTETGVVGQTKQYFLPINEEIWKELSRNALNGVLDRTRHIRGVVSVLCVDISESMSTGNAWGQAKMFVNDFLTGLEEVKSKDDRILDEYVALVTFGHETKIQQVLTNDYNDIRCQMESIALGGPSPLCGGLFIGHACAISAYENAPSFHGLILTPKLIVITDGRPTETRLIAGPDVQDESHMEEILSDVATAVRGIDRANNHILFIGVGDYNKSFIENTSAIIASKLYNFKDGRRLAKNGYFESLLTSQGYNLSDNTSTGLSTEDKEDINYCRSDTIRRLEKDLGCLFQENQHANLPALGTRVRLQQDDTRQTFDLNGPGTVVGHLDGAVLVTWDLNDFTSQYRYGDDVGEVQTVHEPRIVNTLAAGCRVKPGPDFDYKLHGIDPTIRGVVLRVYEQLAMVIWDNGERDKFTYGQDGTKEIDLA